MNAPFDPPLRLLTAFQDIYPSASPEHLIQAPGREMWTAALTLSEAKYTIHAPDLQSRATFNWRSAKFKQTTLKRPLPRWSRYAAGVVYILGADGADVPGVEVVVLGNEVTGPRYNYSIGIGLAALLHTLMERDYTPESLIALLERVRREYVER